MTQRNGSKNMRMGIPHRGRSGIGDRGFSANRHSPARLLLISLPIILAGSGCGAGGLLVAGPGPCQQSGAFPDDAFSMAFVTFIPLARNDGVPVSESEMDEILAGLEHQFGGLTVEGEVDGRWVDPETNIRYEDRSLKVLVAFEPDRLQEARDAVRAIGDRLDQLAMYFEIHDCVEILDSDGTK